MLVGFTAVGLVVAALYPPESADDGPILCPFRLATGLPCPGCGLTRSWIALAHGDVRGSLGEHPFGWAFMAAGTVLLVAVVIAVLRRRPLPPPTRVLGRAVPIALFVGTVVFGSVRLISQAVS